MAHAGLAFWRRVTVDNGTTRDRDSGLLNARAFGVVGGRVLHRCAERGERCGLVFVKLTSATSDGQLSGLGRRGGIRFAASLLLGETRGEDVCARPAERELCALLAGLGDEEVSAVAAGVRTAFGLVGAPLSGEDVVDRCDRGLAHVAVGWAVASPAAGLDERSLATLCQKARDAAL